MRRAYTGGLQKKSNTGARSICALLLISALIAGSGGRAAAPGGYAAGAPGGNAAAATAAADASVTAGRRDALELFEAYLSDVLIQQYGMLNGHEIILERTGPVSAEEYLKQFNEFFIEEYDMEKVAELNKIKFRLNEIDVKESLAAAYAVDMDGDGIPELVTARYANATTTDYLDEEDGSETPGFFCVAEFYAAGGGGVEKIGEAVTDEVFYNNWANVLLAVRDAPKGKNVLLYSAGGGHEYSWNTATLFRKSGKRVDAYIDARYSGGEGYMWYKFEDTDAGIEFEADTNQSYDSEVRLLGGKFPENGNWKDANGLSASIDNLYSSVLGFKYYDLDWDIDVNKLQYKEYKFILTALLRQNDDAPGFYFTPFSIKLNGNGEYNINPKTAATASAPSDWAAGEVGLARGAGLATEKTTRDYQKDITREEFCELAVKLYDKMKGAGGDAAANASAGAPNPAGTPSAQGAKGGRFTDTKNPEVERAFNLGIVLGVSDTLFEPNRHVTRQEICVMLVRAVGAASAGANVMPKTRHVFADGGDIADWAADAVGYAFENEILRGVGGNKMDPLGNTTCEQAIIMCYRASKNH